VGQLYAVNVDGSGLERLTSGPWSYVQPVWSADGSRLYAYQNQENEVGEFGALVVIQARKESAAELP
jgi:Tol biopolymer transport system component